VSAPESATETSPRRHKILRGLKFERWRVVAWFKWWHGLGNPLFEFEFRFGRPAPVRQPEYVDLEGDLGDGLGL
jgi:hypothetical protein